MTAILDLAIAAVSGGGGTVVLQTGHAWLRGRAFARRSDRDADLKLEEHRDSLTFDLLSAAREEMAQLRNEVADLRPLQARVAHLEEALDHIHALLHAENEVERAAAERRARAFLRRMRPKVGDLRNQQMTNIVAQTLRGEGDHEGDDTTGERIRRLPPRSET